MDAGVDLDHLTNSIGWFDVEKDLIKEGKTDDRPRTRNNISQISLIVCWADTIKEWNVKPTCQQLNNFRPAIRNIRFLFEDHSYPDYNPPDNNQSQI